MLPMTYKRFKDKYNGYYFDYDALKETIQPRFGESYNRLENLDKDLETMLMTEFRILKKDDVNGGFFCDENKRCGFVASIRAKGVEIHIIDYFNNKSYLDLDAPDSAYWWYGVSSGAGGMKSLDTCLEEMKDFFK